MMFTNQLSRGSYSFQRRGRPPKPIVNIAVTLDPNKFAEKEQKRLHIGSLAFFHLYIALHNQSSPVKALPHLYYDWTEINSSFPPDTKTFLYYSTSSTRPRIAGELRLRVASSDDPASFESGSDLLGLNGRPWSRSLFAVSKFYIPLPVYEILRKEHHVPDDLLPETLFNVCIHLMTHLPSTSVALNGVYPSRHGYDAFRWTSFRSPSNVKRTLHRCITKLSSLNTPGLMILMNL